MYQDPCRVFCSHCKLISSATEVFTCSESRLKQVELFELFLNYFNYLHLFKQLSMLIQCDVTLTPRGRIFFRMNLFFVLEVLYKNKSVRVPSEYSLPANASGGVSNFAQIIRTD